MTKKPIYYTQELKHFPAAPTLHPDSPEPDKVLGPYKKQGHPNQPYAGIWYGKWLDVDGQAWEWPINGTHFIGNWNWQSGRTGTYNIGNQAAFNKAIFTNEDIFTVPANSLITQAYFGCGAANAPVASAIVYAIVIDVARRFVIDIVPGFTTPAFPGSGFTTCSIPINRSYRVNTTVGIYTPFGLAYTDDDRLNGEVYGIRHENLEVGKSLSQIGNAISTSTKRPALGIEYLIPRPNAGETGFIDPVDRAVTFDRFPTFPTVVGHAGNKGLVYRQGFDLTTPAAVDTEQVIVADGVDLLLQAEGTIMHPQGGNILVDSVFGLIRHLDKKVSIFAPTEYFTNARYCVAIEWISASAPIPA